MRFQKRIKVLPGVTLNLSKSGISTSIGTTGARVTYGHGQRRTTLGIPGSGLSHTTIARTAKSAPEAPAAGDEPSRKDILIGCAIAATLIGTLIAIFG